MPILIILKWSFTFHSKVPISLPYLLLSSGTLCFMPFILVISSSCYEHHPWFKQLVVENDLPQKLQTLIEERRDGQCSGGQVLVI